jgi:hypothetical protein
METPSAEDLPSDVTRMDMLPDVAGMICHGPYDRPGLLLPLNTPKRLPPSKSPS